MLDRRWLGGHAVTFIAGTAPRPMDQSRALFVEYMRCNPHHPLACRVEREQQRWMPVPEREREAHAERLVITADDPHPDRLDEYIRTQIAALPPDLPFLAVVTESSLFIIMSHAVGDAVTLGYLVWGLLLPDGTPHEAVQRLAAVEPRMRRSLAVRELLRGLPQHRDDWLRHVRRHLRRGSAGAAPAVRPVTIGPSRPAFTGTVITNEQLREISRWRNHNAPGTSIAAVLTTATYRALTAEGLGIDGHGYYCLFDMRQFLPGSAPMCGNMAKSLHLTAELNDPRSVSDALRAAGESRRVVPAIALGSAMRQRRPPSAAGTDPRTPLTLTFTVMPGFIAMPKLVPVAGSDRRMYAFGTPASPGGIVVSALRLREHMQVTASFDESTIPAETVRRALESLADIRSVLEARPARSESR